jgi:hypothetical protein
MSLICVVLEGFLDLHVLEETCLLQVRDQVRHRVRTQRRAFQAYIAPVSSMLLSQTASVPFTVSPSMASKLTGPA